MTVRGLAERTRQSYTSVLIKNQDDYLLWN
jgi:hypothetical protein